MSDVRTPRETAELLLRTITEGTRDDLADLYAEDVVITNKFAPEGVPSTAHGNAALRARMKGMGDLLAYDRIDDVVIHETADPEVVIVEFSLDGHVKSDGSTFRLGFVNVMRVVEGLIAESRDYGDALAVQKVFARMGEGEGRREG